MRLRILSHISKSSDIEQTDQTDQVSKIIHFCALLLIKVSESHLCLQFTGHWLWVCVLQPLETFHETQTPVYEDTRNEARFSKILFCSCWRTLQFIISQEREWHHRSWKIIEQMSYKNEDASSKTSIYFLRITEPTHHIQHWDVITTTWKTIPKEDNSNMQHQYSKWVYRWMHATQMYQTNSLYTPKEKTHLNRSVFSSFLFTLLSEIAKEKYGKYASFINKGNYWFNKFAFAKLFGQYIWCFWKSRALTFLCVLPIWMI